LFPDLDFESIALGPADVGVGQLVVEGIGIDEIEVGLGVKGEMVEMLGFEAGTEAAPLETVVVTLIRFEEGGIGLEATGKGEFLEGEVVLVLIQHGPIEQVAERGGSHRGLVVDHDFVGVAGRGESRSEENGGGKVTKM
jgi:hypothetical protein